jgi:hypothetical protein
VLCETAPGVVKKGDWSHNAVTGDKSIFRIFVNGKETQKTAFKDTNGNSTTIMSPMTAAEKNIVV